MTTKQEYRQFLDVNFKGLRIKTPLFYNWDAGLRFNLQSGESYDSNRLIIDGEGNVLPQVGDTDSDEYFQEVTKRATTIFQSAFDNSDRVFLVLMDFKYRRKKIKFSNFIFNQIYNLRKTEVSFTKAKGIYVLNSKFDISNIAIIKIKTERINHRNILTAIGHTDFPPRKPRLDNNGVFTNKEIFFINRKMSIIKFENFFFNFTLGQGQNGNFESLLAAHLMQL